MTLMIFEENNIYEPRDEEMRILGTVEKLAQWRHRGRGPAYVKSGRKILYLGADLNAWLSERRVVTSCHAKIEAKAQADKFRARQKQFEQNS